MAVGKLGGTVFSAQALDANVSGSAAFSALAAVEFVVGEVGAQASASGLTGFACRETVADVAALSWFAEVLVFAWISRKSGIATSENGPY